MGPNWRDLSNYLGLYLFFFPFLFLTSPVSPPSFFPFPSPIWPACCKLLYVTTKDFETISQNVIPHLNCLCQILCLSLPQVT